VGRPATYDALEAILISSTLLSRHNITLYFSYGTYQEGIKRKSSGRLLGAGKDQIDIGLGKLLIDQLAILSKGRTRVSMVGSYYCSRTRAIAGLLRQQLPTRDLLPNSITLHSLLNLLLSISCWGEDVPKEAKDWKTSKRGWVWMDICQVVCGTAWVCFGDQAWGENKRRKSTSDKE